MTSSTQKTMQISQIFMFIIIMKYVERIFNVMSCSINIQNSAKKICCIHCHFIMEKNYQAQLQNYPFSQFWAKRSLDITSSTTQGGGGSFKIGNL